jgi:multidrug resistance efflux pump
MGGEGQDHGLVLVAEGLGRNAELVPLLASTVRIAAPRARAKKPFMQRMRGWAVAALILIGVVMVPLPDGTKLSATVTAENFRIITAPYSAAIVDMAVADNQSVTGDETVLARLDVTETVNELIASQADFAAALLEREGARADRNAAALRNAELEAERIAARITLLEAQRDAATLVAPISGLVIGPDLQGRRGSVVSQGDVLMQIADPVAFRLDVNIQQDQLAKLTTDMAGVFRPDFDPSLAFDVTLTAISPAALDTERAPVFPGRAALPAEVDALRHGMTGVVSVDREWRPAGLQLWDAIQDWFLLRLWL